MSAGIDGERVGRVGRVGASRRVCVLVSALLLGVACRPRAPVAGQCAYTSDCADNLMCLGGVCRAVCQTERDCVPPALCAVSPTNGLRACLPPEAEALCRTDGDCPAPSACVTNGRCRYRCMADIDCAPDRGRCVSSEGTCERGPTVVQQIDGGADASDGATDAAIDATMDVTTDVSADRVSDTVADVPADAYYGACASGVCTSCWAWHAMDPSRRSGLAMVGTPGRTRFVECDMDNDGGGWTIVFAPIETNYDFDGVSWTHDDAPLLAGAREVLLAFRDASGRVVDRRARFAIPDFWRMMAPFQYNRVDEPIAAFLDGAESPRAATLRYGRDGFGTGSCADPWAASTDPHEGRLCLQGTDAPFYSLWWSPTPDGCAPSDRSATSTVCSASRRFTIAVR